MELDHLFILTDRGAPAADALIPLGFAEGAPNVHPGQGTACRRFFFANAYLEFLWVHDETEAAGEAMRRTRLLERWRARASGASPFGIALRPRTPDEAPPFRTWDYRPPWLAEGALPVATNSERLDEPFLFVLPFGRRPAEPGTARASTRVVLDTPAAAPSAAAITMAHHGMATLRPADEHGLLVEFDHAAAGGEADLRPALPLRLRW